MATLTEEEKKKKLAKIASYTVPTQAGPVVTSQTTLKPVVPSTTTTKATTPTASSGGSVVSAPTTTKSSFGTFTADDMAKGLNRAVISGMNQIGYENKLIPQYAKELYGSITGNQNLVNDAKQKSQAALTDYQNKQNYLDERYGVPETRLGNIVSNAVTGAVNMAPLMVTGVGTKAVTSGLKVAPKVANTAVKLATDSAMFAQTAPSANVQALNEGATDKQALAYSGLNGVANVLSEKVFAGIPGLPKSNIDDWVMGKISKGIDNKTMAEFAKWVTERAGEGLEEVVVDVADPYLKRATYDKNAANATLDQLFDSFATGAVTSAMLGSAASVPNVARNVQQNLSPTAIQNRQQAREYQALNGIDLQTAIAQAQKSSANAESDVVAKAQAQQTAAVNRINELSRQIPQTPEQALQDRDWQSVGNRSVNAVMYDNPTMKPIIQRASAEIFQDYNENGTKGQRSATQNDYGDWVNTSTTRQQNSVITSLLDSGMTYKQIEDGFQRIAEDSGKENTANAKRVEMEVLDAINTNEWTSSYGETIPTDGQFHAEPLPILNGMNLEELQNLGDTISKRMTGQTDANLMMEYADQLEQIDNAINIVRGRTANANVNTEQSYSDFIRNAVLLDYDRNKINAGSRNFIERMEQATGQKIRIVTGMRQELPNGKVREAEGFFDHSTNTLVLNANKIGTEEMARYLVSHEIYHSFRDNTSAFHDLQDLAYQYWLADHPNGSRNQMLQDKINEYSGNGVYLDVDGAWDEIAAEFVGKMMTDEAVANRVLNQNRSFAEMFLQKIRDMFSRINPRLSREDKAKQDILRKAEAMYSKGLRDMASANMPIDSLSVENGAEGTVYSKDGTPVVQQQDGEVMFNFTTYKGEGREALKKYLNSLVKKKRYNKSDAEEVLRFMDFVANEIGELMNGADVNDFAYFKNWNEQVPVVSADGKPLVSFIKTNGTYEMNIDASRVCAKRTAVDALMKNLVKNPSFDVSRLAQEDFVDINDILKEEGFLVACSMCNVETKRFRLGEWAKSVSDEYNAFFDVANITNGVADIDAMNNLADSMVANLGEKEKAGRRKTLQKWINYIADNANKVYRLDPQTLMNSEGMMNLKGSDSDLYSLVVNRKAQATPKPLEGNAIYDSPLLGLNLQDENNERLNPMMWGVDRAFEVGGVRIQSFSDYMPHLFFDYCQMFADLAARQLPAHSYTKVQDYVKLFGKTGAKINMSLVPRATTPGCPAGLKFDNSGNLVYDWADESFPYDVALDIQNTDGYTDNCGTCAMGVSKEHIWKLFEDDDIKMIIPYHKSGISPIVAAKEGIDKFTDYTNHQEEKIANDKSARKKGESFQDYYKRITQKDNSSYGSALPVNKKKFDFYSALDEYENPVKASFEYVKFCQENKIIPKFPEFVYDSEGNFNENYYKVIVDFSVLNKDGEYAPQTSVQWGENAMPADWKDIMMDSLKSEQSEFDKMDEGLKKVEQRVIEKFPQYRTPSDEIRFSISAEEDAEYMNAVNSGDMATAQSMVDDTARRAGYTVVTYHGTESENDFNVFNVENAGVFTTTDRQTATTYAKQGTDNVKKVYINTDGYLIVEGNNSPNRYIDVPREILEKHPYWFENGVGSTNEIADVAKELGYKGVVFKNIADHGLNNREYVRDENVKSYESYSMKELDNKYSDVYVSFDSNQLKSADPITYDDNGNVIPLSKRFNASENDIRYSMSDNSEYNRMLDEYGAMEPGGNPYGRNRDIQVPQSTDGLDKTRRFNRTAMESEQVAEETVSNLQRRLSANPNDGKMTYTPISNKEALATANGNLDSQINEFMSNGYNRGDAVRETLRMEYQKFRGMVSSGQLPNVSDIAKAERMVQLAQDIGDYQLASDIIVDMSVIGTQMGQAIQAYSMMKRLTPAGQLASIRRSIERINTQQEQKGGNRITVPPALEAEFLEARGQAQREEIADKMYKEIAQQVEGTWIDKINAYRYSCMLCNPATHLRNIISNGAMFTVGKMGDTLSGAMQDAFNRNGEKTKSLRGLNQVQRRQLAGFVDDAWENTGKRALSESGSRYNNETSKINQNKRIFKNGVLEATIGNGDYSVSSMLEKEDMLGKEINFKAALIDYLIANNLSETDCKNGVVKENGASFERGLRYAERQAKKRTFTEDNLVSNAINDFENKTGVAGKIILGGLIPFRRTPLNIMVRGIEYSPAGLGMTIYKAVKARNKTKGLNGSFYDINDVLDSLGANFTGSAIMAAGFWLAAQGMLNAGGGDDDKKDQWEKDMGEQDFSIVLPDGSTLSIDWLSPVAMPLLSGAAAYKVLNNGNDDELSPYEITRIAESIGKIADPAFEMSCMQGVTSALKSYSSGTVESGTNVLLSTATSYGGQFIPQVVNKTAQAIDDTRRSSYAPKDGAVPKKIAQFANQQENKIPFVSMTNEASIDRWGRDAKREFSGDQATDFAARLLNGMFNPSTYSSNKKTKIDTELDKLYDKVGDAGVYPSKHSSYVTYGGETVYMDAQQYTQYGRTKGQKSEKYVSNFMSSQYYRKLSDDSKAEVIKDLYGLAQYEAKKQFIKDEKGRFDTSSYKSYEAALSSKDPVKYYAQREMASSAGISLSGDYETVLANCDKMKMDYGKYASVSGKISSIKSNKNNKGADGTYKTAVKQELNKQYQNKQITSEQWWYMWLSYSNSKANRNACPYQWMRQYYEKK